MAVARNVVRHGLEMRAQFDYTQYSLNSWYLRHMHVGLIQMQGKLHGMDAVIEVHDARIPYTGRNLKLSDIGILKPSILVMNKIDLIRPQFQQEIKSRFSAMSQEVLFTNSKDSKDKGISSIIPEILSKLKDANRFNRSEFAEINVMILGVPNVGKSSLINALRSRNLHRKKAAHVAPMPGVTRCVMERIKINRRPEVFIRDTPGVLSPTIPSAEAGLKLALSAIVDENLAGPECMADYLLFRLNKAGRREYVDVLGLQGPTDSHYKLLTTLAVRHDMIIKGSLRLGVKDAPNLTAAAHLFIKHWRSGEFGCQMLDDKYC